MLHIGASTKREEKGHYAGYFGEGFKIAALCGVRDHHWNITILSRDWELEVVTTHVDVDHRSLKSLAYEIKKNQPERRETILKISPFNDRELLNSVLLSFHYPTNPLFGQKIWSSDTCAVYHRSLEQKPYGYPRTDRDAGLGIVFAGYQAIGSFQYPLIFCVHDSRQTDRERNTFYRMNVIDLIQTMVFRLPPEPSAIVLQMLKSRWYDRPRKKYDLESWHGIIRTLVKNISTSSQQTSQWKQSYPNLVVAKQVKRTDLPNYNRRRQALDWPSHSGQSLRLVQDAFCLLGYPTLETVCEQNDGFSVTRNPGAFEQSRVEMLERFVQILLPELFADLPLPPCKIIKSERAGWRGMAICMPIATRTHQFRGILVRYQLPYVALKASLLHSDNFGNALSTYLHELAHMFGGDRSASFSHALSELMEVILSHARLIAECQEQWERVQA